jgi:hypothetical protein
MPAYQLLLIMEGHTVICEWAAVRGLRRGRRVPEEPLLPSSLE